MHLGSKAHYQLGKEARDIFTGISSTNAQVCVRNKTTIDGVDGALVGTIQVSKAATWF
jgi:hypothetical protein